MIKKSCFRVLLALSLLLAVIGQAQAAQVLDRIVAVVNGEIITYVDLQQQIRLIAGQTPPAEEAAKIAPQVLDGMIDDIIMRQEAARLQVEVSDSEVDNEIRQFKARHRMTEDDFERSLRLQGLTAEQFKERSRQDIVKHKIINYMVRRKVVVTQEEIDAYKERNSAELTTERTVDLQILAVMDSAQAEELWTRIGAGEIGFAEAVDRYSVGPKADDGVMAGVRWRDLAEPWRQALRDLSVGDMSRPELIQERWVILKLLDRKDEARQEQGTVEDEVREAIMRPKLEERFKEYMAGLRAKAVIEKRL
ncbi:SurA N-terminal domain-containing protein [Desulfomicrobium salsuginis]